MDGITAEILKVATCYLSLLHIVQANAYNRTFKDHNLPDQGKIGTVIPIATHKKDSIVPKFETHYPYKNYSESIFYHSAAKHSKHTLNVILPKSQSAYQEDHSTAMSS